MLSVRCAVRGAAATEMSPRRGKQTRDNVAGGCLLLGFLFFFVCLWEWFERHDFALGALSLVCVCVHVYVSQC